MSALDPSFTFRARTDILSAQVRYFKIKVALVRNFLHNGFDLYLTQMPQTAEDILKNIVQGKTEQIAPDHERKYKLVEDGTKIPNAVLIEIVKQMRESGVDHKEILRKILYFDYLAEKGELISYLEELAE